MKIISDRHEVLKRLLERGGIPILCPNAETPEEMEGIFLGAQRHAVARDMSAVVVGIGVTASYPDHPQLGRLAMGEGSGALESAARTWLGWLDVSAGRDGLFGRVEAIPFLDHGWVPLEADLHLMKSHWFQEVMGIIMFDASLYEFEKNAELTAAYVKEAGSRVVVEACPDKVYERAEIERKQLNEAGMLSDPLRVREFVNLTGVDLVVPNLGTEHRTRSKVPLEYRRDIAQDIARQVGPIQALHGTSSLGERLRTVGEDGICKVNFYTAMARGASAALKAGWDRVPSGEPLPISLACGSAIHVSRRDVFADKTRSMLEWLAGGI
jgi:fructose/tagatose bisphosphate aldolase